MKIAVLSTYIENYVLPASFKIRLLTARKFAERGHDVVFISPANNSRRMIRKACGPNLTCYATPGLFPKRLRVGGFSFLDAVFKIWLVWRSNVDVIQATNGHRPAQLIPCIVGKYVRRSVIVDECWEWLGKGGYADKRRGIVGNIIALYDRFAELRLKRIFDHIITISNVLKKRFRDTQNVTVLHGGTENSTLVPYGVLEARQDLGLQKEAFIVGMSNVCVGDHEDNAVFFQAFSQLAREHRQLFLLLTGPEKDYVDRISGEYTLSGRVISPGWVDFPRYNKYLSSCNLFVLPLGNGTINEGRWPNKIGDYLCLNRPIVSNPTGDLKEFFEKYTIGSLCEETPDGFYSALKKFLDDRNDLMSYAADSLYVANEILSFDKRIDNFLAIFEKRLKAKRHLAQA